MTTADLLLICFFFVLLSQLNKKTKQIYLLLALSGLMISVGIVASSAINGVLGEGIYIASRYFLAISVGFACFQLFTLNRLYKLLFYGYVVSGVVTIVTCTFYVLWGESALFANWTSAGRLSLWISPNGLSVVLAFGAITSLYFMFADYRHFYIHIILCSFFSLALVFTMSFGGLITFILMTTTMMVTLSGCKQFRKKVVLVSFTLLAVSSAGLFVLSANPSQFPGRLENRLVSTVLTGQSKERDSGEIGSSKVRIYYIETAMEHISKNPFIGLGAASKDSVDTYPHVVPILLWLEGGILSLAGYVLFFLLLFFYFIHNLCTSRMTLSAHLGLALTVGLFVTSMGHAHMYQFYYYYYLAIVLAITLGCSKTKRVLC